MANINSLMSNTSSTNSLYGNRNILSGLASGMDTEAMIENSISGYKTKITQLEQQQTKYQWKQDAYRSITDKMYDLTQKYTSYTSKTNLYSPTYFNTAISTEVVGSTDAVSKISATGTSTSDIQILAAKAATASRYDVSAKALGLQTGEAAINAQNLSGTLDIGTLKGSFTLNYDGQKIDISFDETDTGINGTGDGSKTLVEAIKEKLANQTVKTSYGTKKASEVISVGVNGNGAITFSETAAGGQGATPYISSISSSLKSALGASESELYSGSGTKKYTISNVNTDFNTQQNKADYLAGKDISVTVDGVTKTFRLDKDLLNSDDLKGAFQKGFDSIGVKVDIEGTGGNLTFTPKNATSNLSISTNDAKADEALGISGTISNYLSEKTSIGSLLGSKFQFTDANAAKETDTSIIDRLPQSSDGQIVTDTETGNRYLNKNNEFYRVNEKGDYLYELKINDKSIYVAKDASLESVLEGINSSDMGVTATYSKLTGKFVFTAKETGASGDINFGEGLAESLFSGTAKISDVKMSDVFDEELFDSNGNLSFTIGSTPYTYNKNDSVSDFLKAFTDATVRFKDSNNDGNFNGFNLQAVNATGVNLTYTRNETPETMTLDEFVNRVNNANSTAGTDATVRAMVNGEAVTLQRASNTIEMDGMSVTLKGDINDLNASDADNKANAVSFKTSSNSDDLVSTIRGFVDDYNALLKELHDAYATQPAEKSAKNHTRYEPLTEDDKKDMSEKAIENYEAKAKQGILFGDSDLRAAYESLVRNITASGADGVALRDMGIETTYSNGMTQITLNESKLREALEKNPDSVRNAFTKSKESGAATDGLMASVKKTLEQYGSTSYSTPGILVKKGGSTHNATSLLNNDLQTQLDKVQQQIEQWQTKMSSKIDYYTRQFTALEKLMNTMNSQSSALAGLMGM